MEPTQDPSEVKHYYEVRDLSYKQNSVNYYRLFNKENNGNMILADQMVSIDNRMENKQILYRTNLLGQIVSENQRGLIILVYEDGSSERVMLED